MHWLSILYQKFLIYIPILFHISFLKIVMVVYSSWHNQITIFPVQINISAYESEYFWTAFETLSKVSNLFLGNLIRNLNVYAWTISWLIIFKLLLKHTRTGFKSAPKRCSNLPYIKELVFPQCNVLVNNTDVYRSFCQFKLNK